MKNVVMFSDYVAETEQGWQSRIRKDQGSVALSHYLSMTYPNSSEKPIGPLSAEEFYVINRLTSEGKLVKELLKKLNQFSATKCSVDAKTSSQFIELFDAWVSNPIYERRKGLSELQNAMDGITPGLVNMNTYLDSRFVGNVLCFVMYQPDMELFKGLLEASWLDINAESDEFTNALYFLLYTWDYYQKLNHDENVIATLDKMFDLMLEKGADVNTNPECGYTALMYAAASGNKRP